MSQKPPLENIDPQKIYLHAIGFHTAEDILGKLTSGRDVHLSSRIVEPSIVISALTSELFLKCLICIETTLTPRGHHLAELFKLLKPETQNQAIALWDKHIVPARETMWKMIEANLGNAKLKRDLLGAMLAGSRAFEKLRYSYEGEMADTTFYIGDLPRILNRIILQTKPEWQHLGRQVTELAKPNPDQK